MGWGSIKYNYRKLLSEREFLKVQKRSLQLRKYGSLLTDVLYDKSRLVFKTHSATYPEEVVYTQTIEFEDVDYDYITDMNFADVESLVLNSGIKIHCDCPAFHYWGYKYIAWKRGYGLQREVRPPYIRNPFERGFLCKHLYLVLGLFPTLSKVIASKFSRYANKKDSGRALSGRKEWENQRKTSFDEKNSLQKGMTEEFRLNGNKKK